MKRKLGVNIDCIGDGFDEVRTLELAHQTGFEVFTGSKRPVEMMARIKEKAVELGMEFPFLHSPYSGINNLWLEGDDYRTIFEGIIESVDIAATFEIGAVVTHVSSGWQAPPVNDLGLSRFDALVEYANKKNITLAFENLRMVGNLAYLIDRYEHCDNVRFCFDCGHEHCYTKTVPWIDIFTNKIIATHIHDNMSRPFGDKSTDPDSHWLPFDGTYNYHEMMRKLDKYGYAGPLVLEIYRKARADYKELSPEEFIATSYDRIKRISTLNNL